MRPPRRLLSALSAALLLCASASGQDAATASDPIGQVGRNAEERLARSVADLNALREQVAADKLPLAQQLTGLEEKLTGLRKENDRLTRLVDAGALEITVLRQEIKARQEELSYVGGLLDEYARNLETRVAVGEIQQIGEALVAAKNAVEDKTLSMSDRFARQTDFVDRSIGRVEAAIGGATFPGVAVDSLGTVTEGQFALIGPVTLFGANAATGAVAAPGGQPVAPLAGLAVAQAGSDRPLIRPLEGELQKHVTTLVATGEGVLPLDPSRGGALKALIQKTNLVHIFIKGGPIMWPLLAASILAMIVVLERVFFLLNEQRKRNRRAVGKVFEAVKKGDIDGALAITRKSKDCVVTTLGYALEHRELSIENALAYAQARALKRFRRGVAVLDTIITLAPLLGLLGTVTGMMGSFAVIGGELSSPGAITGGIAEALIATAFGLGIAILALLPFNYLNNKIEEIEGEIDTASAQLRLLMENNARVPHHVRPSAPPMPTAASVPAPALATAGRN